MEFIINGSKMIKSNADINRRHNSAAQTMHPSHLLWAIHSCAKRYLLFRIQFKNRWLKPFSGHVPHIKLHSQALRNCAGRQKCACWPPHLQIKAIVWHRHAMGDVYRSEPICGCRKRTAYLIAYKVVNGWSGHRMWTWKSCRPWKALYDLVHS